ncbi:P-loop containing nucleoside triphosphate hydrolase protein [Chytriomyces cf. hyalinus JEL632]|nr:P-loop containing nucleoside triphosphate hydrolase protein [Chytriomyces cf. hyalinus JEL632]
MSSASNCSLGPKATLSTILVALRIRPLSSKEVKENVSAAIKIAGKKSLVVTDFSDAQDPLRQDRPREKLYEFDAVYPETASQVQVFEGTTKTLVDYVLQGFNTTVFAYGATGAGKTYTMQGTPENPGIMPQTLDHLFQQIKKASRIQTSHGNANPQQNPTGATSQSYKVTLSYLEIYNENIRDLLSGRPDYLELWEDRLRGSVVSGIERVEAKTAADVLDWLEKGNLNRTQEATGANEASSRSHAVLQVFVVKRTCNKKGQYTEQNGKLSMIDLAGSERAADTKNRGMRMIEGASINRSLLALGNCINALSDDSGGGKYVNYRDSKLTRLLKDSLGGNCKTVMIANISPVALNFEETLNTLKYASRTRAIKNKVCQHAPVLLPKHSSISKTGSTSSKSTLSSSQLSLIELPSTRTSKLKRSNSDRNMLTRMSSDTLTAARAGPPPVHPRYLLGTSSTVQAYSKPSTAATATMIASNSMLGELENCLLESFSERKQLQKNLNLVDLKIGEMEEKLSRKKLRAGLAGSAADDKDETCRKALVKCEEEEGKLRAIRRGVVKKILSLDEKVKSINQTLPRSLDSHCLRYLESRVKTYMIELENLKLEGMHSKLNSKLRKQDSEISVFLNQLLLLKDITSMQKELLEQKRIALPDKLQASYQKLLSAVSRPASSESIESQVTSSSRASTGKEEIILDHGSDQSSSDEAEVHPPTKNAVKSVLAAQPSEVSITGSESTMASSGYSDSCDPSSKTTTTTTNDNPSKLQQPKFKLPDIYQKVSNDPIPAPPPPPIVSKVCALPLLVPKDHVSPATEPVVQDDSRLDAKPQLDVKSSHKKGIGNIEPGSLKETPRQQQQQQQHSKSDIGPQNVAGAGNAGVATKMKQSSNAKTLREAREEIQTQIREARAERQRIRQSQEFEPPQLKQPGNNVRPPSERKAKVVAGKGITI